MVFSNIVLTKNTVQYTRRYYNTFKLIASLLINLLEINKATLKGDVTLNLFSIIYQRQGRNNCAWNAIIESISQNRL